VHHLPAADGEHFFRLSVFAERLENVSAGMASRASGTPSPRFKTGCRAARTRTPRLASLRRQKTAFPPASLASSGL